VKYDAIDEDRVRDRPLCTRKLLFVYLHADVEVRLGADGMQGNPIRFQRVVDHASSLAVQRGTRDESSRRGGHQLQGVKRDKPQMYAMEHLVFELMPLVHRQGSVFQLSPYVSDDARLRGYLHLQLLLIHHVGNLWHLDAPRVAEAAPCAIWGRIRYAKLSRNQPDLGTDGFSYPLLTSLKRAFGTA
jgi:hypothetical protein